MGIKQKSFLEALNNKGDISNLITFAIMCAVLVVEIFVLEPEDRKYNLLLAFGLFGFAGGFTNWLAIKMLFERVCGLPGSGIIPMRFKEIREVVKDTILKGFFNDEFLEYYLHRRVPAMLESMGIEDQLVAMINSPEFDKNLN